MFCGATTGLQIFQREGKGVWLGEGGPTSKFSLRRRVNLLRRGRTVGRVLWEGGICVYDMGEGTGEGDRWGIFGMGGMADAATN